MIDRQTHTAGLRLLQLAVLSLSWSTVSDASEVYKWVDDEGVVHYSDTRPRNDASITTLELSELNSEDYDPATDPYSILNQAKRVSESWRERIAAQQAEDRSEDSGKEPRYDFSPYAPFRYYPATAYYAAALPSRVGRKPGAARRQLEALNALDLGGQRPQSINSGAHRERILRSGSLPIVAPDTRPGFAVSP